MIALDCRTQAEALGWVSRLSTVEPDLVFKVGLELFTACGPSVVDAIRAKGGRVFLDLKLHDIPQTVAHATQVACELGVAFLTLHSQGGARMITVAREACDRVAANTTQLLAVTALTSFSESEWQEQVGHSESIARGVSRLALLARSAGAHGWVCAAPDLAHLPADFAAYRMVPGIRLAGGDAHDQRRVMTPREAADAGASGLVLGRAILEAQDPEAALAHICTQLR